MPRKYLSFLLLVSALALLAALTACTPSSTGETTGAVIGSGKANDLTVTLSNPKGRLSEGENEFTVEFKNAAGQHVDVGAITLFFDMPAMGSMAYMKNDAKLTTTQTPGIYRGNVKLDMSGSWQTRISYKGPAGEGKIDFPIQAK
jgi:hypothetical protein